MSHAAKSSVALSFGFSTRFCPNSRLLTIPFIRNVAKLEYSSVPLRLP